MNLKIFFSAVPPNVHEDIKDHNSFFKSIRVFTEKQPEYKDANIAIIGISDEGIGNSQQLHAPDEIRRKLYRLKKGSGTYNIIDLGNLRLGYDAQESHMRLKEVCSFLLEQEILPVIIGGGHDFTYGQYLAYENLDKLVSFLNIDAFLDMAGDAVRIGPSNHMHHILMHEPNFLFNMSHLAYQTYLNDQRTLEVLEKLYFDLHRLGKVRESIKEMEPIVREADFMSFDLCAIKASEASGSTKPQPFGLSGEEACQLCWYAGLNEKMSSVGFYEYDRNNDDAQRTTAAIVATMVWYFIEGFYHRKDESHYRGNDYLRYVVSMPSEPETLVFYRSKLSDKWWIEVPYPRSNFTYERNLIVPCSYSDYELAQKGEIPERWIMMQNKLV